MRADARGAEYGSAGAVSASVLFERYRDGVYGYCYSQLGSREEAEDTTQTTFLHVFRALRRGVVPIAEARWVYAIAQNACRARHRARGRRRQREVLSDPWTLQEVSSAPEGSRDELIGLEHALGEMPEQQREAILLREWRGLSYREIAEEMGLSGAAVETLIFRARRSLAQILKGDARPRRRVARVIDVASLGAALKSALAGAPAVKAVAATVAALATAGLIAGATPQEDARSDPPVPHRTVVSAVPERAIARSGQSERAEQIARSSRAADKKATKQAPVAPAPAATEADDRDATSPPAGGVVETAETVTGLSPEVAVPSVPPLEVPGTVGDVVEPVTEAADSLPDVLP